MQFPDQCSIVDAANFRDRLLQHLPYRIRLCDISIDSVSRTSILGEIILNHLSVLEVVGFRIPAIRNEYPFRRLEPDSLDKIGTCVRAGGGNQGYWIVALLPESLNERGKIREQSTQDHYLRTGGNHRVGERRVVFRGSRRVDMVVDGFDSTIF